MELTQQSLMSLYVEIYRDDLQVSTGTAFVVKHDTQCYLITNRHNVTGRNTRTGKCLDKYCSIPNKLRVYCNKNLTHIEWLRLDLSLYKDDDNQIPSWFEHSVYKNKIDVVALLIPHYLQHLAYDLNQLTDIKINPSDYLSVVGFPFGKSASGYIAIWTTGFLGSDYDVDYEQLPCFLLDARTRQGQSGSPVIAFRTTSYTDTHGNTNFITGPKNWLFGIYSGRINDESDLGIVWKVSVIKELVHNPIFGIIEPI